MCPAPRKGPATRAWPSADSVVCVVARWHKSPDMRKFLLSSDYMHHIGVENGIGIIEGETLTFKQMPAEAVRDLISPMTNFKKWKANQR